MKKRLLKSLVLALALSMLPIGAISSAAAQVKAYSSQASAIQIAENIGVMGMRVKVKASVSGVGFAKIGRAHV